MRFDKYFNYLHLPQFLQDVSKPFADCAKNVTIDSVNKLLATISTFTTYDEDETRDCSWKVEKVKKWLEFADARADDFGKDNEFMKYSMSKLLLEAKDCAVRAALPN